MTKFVANGREMKALEVLAPSNSNKNYVLSSKARDFLARQSKRALVGIFRLARKRSRRKSAYFWRQVKLESWRLLAGIPEIGASSVGKPHYSRSRWTLRGRK